jgi:hypothetical protein
MTASTCTRGATFDAECVETAAHCVFDIAEGLIRSPWGIAGSVEVRRCLAVQLRDIHVRPIWLVVARGYAGRPAVGVCGHRSCTAISPSCTARANIIALELAGRPTSS